MVNLHNPEIDNDPREFLTESFGVTASFYDNIEILDIPIGDVELPKDKVPFELEINGYTYERRE